GDEDELVGPGGGGGQEQRREDEESVHGGSGFGVGPIEGNPVGRRLSTRRAAEPRTGRAGTRKLAGAIRGGPRTVRSRRGRHPGGGASDADDHDGCAGGAAGGRGRGVGPGGQGGQEGYRRCQEAHRQVGAEGQEGQRDARVHQGRQAAAVGRGRREDQQAGGDLQARRQQV